MKSRISDRFAACAAQNRAALVTFFMAGDPDRDTSRAILKALPAAGADVIEYGMPFSDPMADGPAIQWAGMRALKGGHTLRKSLEDIADFRKSDATTPIVLMGYYNPIYVYGVEAFLRDAKAAGVDGLIIVDLPPEEDEELCIPAMAAGSISSASPRRQRMRSACPRSSATPPALSTMFRSPASLARRSRIIPASRMRWLASSSIPPCRSRSASA